MSTRHEARSAPKKTNDPDATGEGAPALGPADEPLLIAEAQLLLAEKRTSLSTIRTGIALFALPMTVTSALIATSKMYDASQVLHLLLPVAGLCVALVVLATYLTTRAILRIRRYDALIERIRACAPRLSEMLD